MSDTEYLAAVERGDMDTAQQMVNEAAKEAGYTIGPVWHGTPNTPFNKFDKAKQGRLDEGFLGSAFYFSGSPDTAWIYAEIPKVSTRGKASGAWIARTFAGRTGYVGKFFIKGSILELQEQIIGRRERDRREVVREALDLPLLSSAKEITEEATRRGYSGVRYTSRYGGEEYAVFHPSQIKSADPVTYDDSGNVIPLSKRFDVTKDDIRNPKTRSGTPPQFPYEYAAYLKKNFPKIWAKGGNIRGNDTFRWWTAYRRGNRSPTVMHWWNVTRPAWIARHFRDHRLPGVIAQIKWGTVGTLGVAGMKRVVEDAIRNEIR